MMLDRSPQRLIVLTIALVIATSLGCRSKSEESASQSRGSVGTSGALTTGENDTKFYLPPANLKSGDVVCQDSSRRLVADGEPRTQPDDKMRRVGECQQPAVNLYTSTDGKQNTTASNDQWFVKVDNGRYLPVRTESGNRP